MGFVGLPSPICLGILWVTWMPGIFFNFQSMKVLYLNLLWIMFHYEHTEWWRARRPKGNNWHLKWGLQTVIPVGHQYKNKISIFKGPGIFFEVIIIVLSLTSLGCLWSRESWSLLIVMLSRSQIYLLWPVLSKSLSLHWSWNETAESRS